MATVKQVEYTCTYCGKKITRSASTGRPQPGQCSRKGTTRDVRPKPHTWVVNRTIGG